MLKLELLPCMIMFGIVLLLLFITFYCCISELLVIVYEVSEFFLIF